MVKVTNVDVADLSLDLENYRVPKKTAEDLELKALIAEDAEAFWALMRSLLNASLLPTENFIVLKSKGKKIVREGNRRIGALKLILGQLPSKGIDVPQDIKERIKKLTPQEREQLLTAPCIVFEETQRSTVDHIVDLIHAKGQPAGRLDWSALGTARWARHQGAQQPGLDLLEAYLDQGTNLTEQDRSQWGGKYPLSVLDDALSKIAARTDTSAIEVVKGYKEDTLESETRSGLERVLRDIGTKELNFPVLRKESSDVLHEIYGFPPEKKKDVGKGDPKSGGGTGGGTDKKKSAKKGATSGVSKSSPKNRSHSLSDPRSVRAALRALMVNGRDRDKVYDLREEAIRLDISQTPLAFCFVLRSMFEISAAAYCRTNRISTKHPSTSRDLGHADVLLLVHNHIVSQASDQKKMAQHLHGAKMELTTKNRWLSVTSMNSLVHHHTFSVAVTDICTSFHRVMPLLQEINK